MTSFQNLVFITIVVVASVSAAFITRQGPHFELDGAPFYVAGTNNYYVPYFDEYSIDAVFSAAKSMNLTVLRTWAFFLTPTNGVQFQKYDAGCHCIVIDTDSPNGLVHLDRVLFYASKYQIRLILTFVGNWQDFGGMDQYVTWLLGSGYHDDFYTNKGILEITIPRS